MTQHIIIGFDKPQAMIALLLTRFGLENHGIQIDNDTYDIMLGVTDTYLKIGTTQIAYPLLLTDIVSAIKQHAVHL